MAKVRKIKSNKMEAVGISILALVILASLIFIFGFKHENKQPFQGPLPIVSDREIVRGDTTKKQVIFTFDCGAGSESVPDVLKVLAEHKIKGTFFMTGEFVERNAEAVRTIVAAGHEIFNHTYHHPHLTQISDADIVKELDQMDMVLKSVAGISSKPFFRPPYGDRNENVRKIAAGAGYQDVFWTVDALDWEESQGMTADEVRTKILENVAPGTIYLMHVGDHITGNILDDVFKTIEARGYKIVSLTQGL